MKKLFLLLTALAMSLNATMYAVPYLPNAEDAASSYLFDDDGQISDRNNAPMTTYTADFTTDFRKSESQEISGTKQRWYISTSQNMVTTGSLGFPVIQLNMCITNGTAYNYGAITGPPVGTYSRSTETTLSNTSTGYYICASSWSDSQAKSSGIMTSSSTMLWLSQGTVTVARGVNGYPYIYTTSTKTKKNNSGTASTNGFTMGSALASYTLTVNTNNSSYGTVGLTDTNIGSTGTRGTWYTTKSGQSSITETAYNGDQITISAAANTGYLFSQWNDGVKTNPRTITISAAATYTAQFTVASTPGTITGVASPAAGGTVTVSPSGQQSAGTIVTLTATANDGYVFDHWNDNNTQTTRTVSVNGNATYTATFLPLYTVSVATADETKGAVSGGGTVASGKTTTISATAFKGYVFSQWNDGNTDNPRTVTATGNTTYTATFTTSSIVETHVVGVAMADYRSNSSYRLYQLQAYVNNPSNLCFCIAVVVPSTNSYGTMLKESFNTSFSSIYTYSALPTGAGQAINGSKVVSNPTVTGTVKNVYDGYYEGDFYFTGNGSYANTYHLHMYFADPTEGNRTQISVDNTATSAAYGHDFGSASTTVSSGNTKLTLSGTNGSSSYSWSGNLWFTGIGGTSYVPTGEYTYGPSSGATTVRSGYTYGNDSYYSYFYCSGASYSWYPMAGRVAVINPNHTSTPLYVETTFCSSKFADIAVLFQHQAYYGDEPALYKITLGTPTNGTNTMSSTEGHGYTYGGITVDQTGDYYYEGTNITLTPTADPGYVFDSWSGASPTDNGNGTYNLRVGATATITAVFRPDVATYAITYNKGANGTGTIAAGEKTHDVDFTLSSNTFTRTGYTQTGWSTTDGGSKAYDLGDTYTGNTALDLYPYWEVNSYTLTWTTDGDALTGTYTSGTVAYGTTIVQPNTPTKASTVQYAYTFNGWSPTPAETMPAAPTTYTATWTQTLRQYALNVAAGANGTVSGGGTYNYGTEHNITATPNTGFRFVQWSDGNTDNPRTITVDETTPDVTYTATFAPNVTYYTLNISAGSNGSVNTAVNGSKEAGTEVEIEATPNTFYEFEKWSDENTDNPRTVTMNSDVTLTATFVLPTTIELNDNEDAAYYTAFDALAGTAGKNVTLARTLKGNTWNTINLPFDVDFTETGNEAYDGMFYEFKGASGDYTGLMLYFGLAGDIKANVPYLVRPAAQLTNPTFHGVTLQAREAKLVGEQGNVKFQGTILPETLTNQGGDSHTVLGLNNNKIYYPNLTSGNLIRAFRGYFVVNAPAGVTPRVRIVVEDQNATAIDVIEMDVDADGDISVPSDTRKYIENGVLIIERNGVRYDATGKMIK